MGKQLGVTHKMLEEVSGYCGETAGCEVSWYCGETAGCEVSGYCGETAGCNS